MSSNANWHPKLGFAHTNLKQGDPLLAQILDDSPPLPCTFQRWNDEGYAIVCLTDEIGGTIRVDPFRLKAELAAISARQPHQLRRALKRNPNKCPQPECGSEAIEAGPVIEPETGTLARHVECSGCGFSWYESYTLADVVSTD